SLRELDGPPQPARAHRTGPHRLHQPGGDRHPPPRSRHSSTKQSATRRYIHHVTGLDRLNGRTPVVGTSPEDGFSPTTPQNEAGRIIDPAVWVPMVTGTPCAAPATADPLDDPPGVRVASCGLTVTL